MAPTPPTVVSLKQSFLAAQTRLLSQPLTPTRAWRSNNSNHDSSDGDSALPEKAVDDALFKLNHRLQQHARRVYAPPATRHVAEQIDQLYWNAAEAATQRGRDRDPDEEGESVEALNLGADLGMYHTTSSLVSHGTNADPCCVPEADPAVIAALPAAWDAGDGSDFPLEAKRYAALVAELRALAERKQQAAARVARLRRMQALLKPFGPSPDGDGPLDSVQENLVTRNGEVEAELHRMRMLLARVGGRVGQLKEQGAQRKGRAGSESGESSAGSLFSERGGGVDDVEMDEQRKVSLLLDKF
jgi:hypothetical protein